jgi:hypothetical protein
VTAPKRTTITARARCSRWRISAVWIGIWASRIVGVVSESLALRMLLWLRREAPRFLTRGMRVRVRA